MLVVLCLFYSSISAFDQLCHFVESVPIVEAFSSSVYILYWLFFLTVNGCLFLGFFDLVAFEIY